MAKGNNKYYFRAEVWFGHNGGVYGEKYKNFEDAVNQLNHFVKYYGHNDVVYCGIQKRFVENDKPFVCPQGGGAH